MEIGFNSLQSIGTSYSIKLNEKEALVFEEDSSYKVEKSDSEKLQEKDEKSKPTQKLSQEEEQLLQDLQARDTEVRAHELAHQSGGAATGGASYTYQQGPDGKMYAIGGEVSISISSGSTHEETIANAQAVIASAMAPANPSGQDIAVASSARVMMMKAQQQLTLEQQSETEGKEVYKNEAQQDTSLETKEDSDLLQIDISA